MRKAIAFFLFSLVLSLRAVEWRDDVYACAANLPDGPGWVPIRVAEVPGTTVLIAMQNTVRQVVFGVNVLNNPPSLNLSDDATVKAIEQLMRGLTYQFFGRSTVQIGATSWLQYPVTSTSGGLNAKGILRFTSANGRIYAVSLLAGGGKEPTQDAELQQAAASFRLLPQIQVAAAKPAPVAAPAKKDKPSDKKPEPPKPATTTDSPSPAEETDEPDYKRIALFASGAVFVLFIFFRIIGKGSKPKPKPAPAPKVVEKNEPKPKAK